MKKLAIIKASIREGKRQKRTQIQKMIYVWVSCCILFLSAALIILSLLVRDCDWLATVFISVGSSAITGCVLYFLSNMRNNKKYKLQLEIISLQDLKKAIHKAMYFPAYMEAIKNERSSTGKHDESKLFNDVLDDLGSCSSELPEKVFSELKFDLDDPFDRDKLQDYAVRFLKSDRKLLLADVYKTLQPIEERVSEMIHDKEIQREFLYNSIV